MAFQTPFLFNERKKGELSTYLLLIVFQVKNTYGLDFEIIKKQLQAVSYGQFLIMSIYDSCMSHKSKLFKNWPWLITHDLKLFSMISKSTPYVFLTENTIKSKYVDNSPFYVHCIEMASETPFVPRGLRWKFCPQGVNFLNALQLNMLFGCNFGLQFQDKTERF